MQFAKLISSQVNFDMFHKTKAYVYEHDRTLQWQKCGIQVTLVVPSPFKDQYTAIKQALGSVQPCFNPRDSPIAVSGKVLSLFAQVLKDLCPNCLPPSQNNDSEMNFVCGAHSTERLH